MASYGQYPATSFPPPNQYPPPPPPRPQLQQPAAAAAAPNQFPPPPPHQQQTNFAAQNPSSGFPHYSQPPPQPLHYNSYPPPPPESMYAPPPPPPPSQQQQHFYHPQPPPPPLPPASAPPPPPSSPPPPPPHPTVTKNETAAVAAASRQHKPSVPSSKSARPRVETEEERRVRKKREIEKAGYQHHTKLKGSHNSVPNNKIQLQMLPSSGSKGGHGSIIGSRVGERKTNPLLTSDRGENKLKKPTTFLCKMKFRNELPDASSQIKLMTLPKDNDRFTKYNITSLEKTFKPELHVDGDLGIPLDLLDLSVYNPPKDQPPMDPEDEELLRDDEEVLPVKKDGIRRKERPTDKGLSWLVKTQYISPLNNDAAKQSLTEKQAKELRERRGGKNILDNFTSRERIIQNIEATFEAAKLSPVHQTKPHLKAVKTYPLYPDFDREEDNFVIATFDSAPTSDSDAFSKLDSSIREAQESRAIMKSYVSRGSDQSEQDSEKFLAYMVPQLNELSKDMLDEQEEMSYSWVREYSYSFRGEYSEEPTTYLVAFDENEARFLPLRTKLMLGKKKARDGRSEDAEDYPVPASVTVRQRSEVSISELNDIMGTSKGTSSSRSRGGRPYRSDDEHDDHDMDEDHKMEDDMDQYSGADDDVSD